MEEHKIDFPDPVFFSPNLLGESISANFSLIYINYTGERYDTFTDNPWAFGDRWDPESCSPKLFPDTRSASLIIPGSPGTASCPLIFQNSDKIDRLLTTITLEDVTRGNPNASVNAQIAGHFFFKGNSRIWSKIEVFEDRVICSAEEETEVDGLIGWNTLYEEIMLTGDFIGRELPLEIRWNGVDVVFQINFVDNPIIKWFTPEDGVTAISGGTKQIESRMALVLPDTSPTFEWEAVKGATRYLLRVLNTSGDTVWEGFSGFEEASYTVPPGVLKPFNMYAYQVDAIASHSGLETDHRTSAPSSNDGNIEFSVEQSNDKPFIELDSRGVHTWNNAAGDPYLVFRVKVHDAQGVPENIESVTVEFPNGDVESLELVSSPSESAGIYYSFGDPLPAVDNDDEDDNAEDDPVYKFKVTDKDGNEFEIAEKLSVAPIDFPTNGTMLPAPYTVLTGTAAEFDWEDIPGAAFYQLEIYNGEGEQIYKLNTIDSSYSLAEGFLKSGENFEWKVSVLREFHDQNVDNGASSASFPIATAPAMVDSDGDGITDEVDKQVDKESDVFDDKTTSGTVLTRGDMLLIVADAPFPEQGVWMAASSADLQENDNTVPASIQTCNDISTMTMDAGDIAIVTCGSVTTDVLQGTVEITFDLGDGKKAEVSLEDGNSLSFDQEKGSFSAPATNSDIVDVYVEGQEDPLEVGPGQTIEVDPVIYVEIDIRPASRSNCFRQNGRGLLPVLIYSNEIFNVSEIDVSSIRMQGLKVKKLRWRDIDLAFKWDFDRDGLTDMLVWLKDTHDWVDTDSGFATLTGKLKRGHSFTGSDKICLKQGRR